MTTGRDDVLPELMAGLFGRIRAELADGTLGDLRMSHVRVLAGRAGRGHQRHRARTQRRDDQAGLRPVRHPPAGTGHLRTSPRPRRRPGAAGVQHARGRSLHARRLRRPRTDRGRSSPQRSGQRRFATFKKVMAELAGQLALKPPSEDGRRPGHDRPQIGGGRRERAVGAVVRRPEPRAAEGVGHLGRGEANQQRALQAGGHPAGQPASARPRATPRRPAAPGCRRRPGRGGRRHRGRGRPR